MTYFEQVARERYDEVLSLAQKPSAKAGRLLARVYRRNWLPHLPRDKNAHVLDLGCGYGLFLAFLADEGYANAIGVDHCEPNVRACAENGRRALRDDIQRFLAEGEDTYDAINLSYVLAHFTRDAALRLVEGAHRRLKPGGALIVAVPNAAAPLFGGRQRYVDITHEIGFSPESLGALLRFGGFEDYRVYPIDVHVLPNPLINVPAKAGWWLLSKLLRALSLLYGIPHMTAFTKNMLAVARKAP